ncbi:type II secretion system protein [Chitinivorax sp. B]|uniref:type II secretion system protein n=1 Tax=Chitinivorax sp. B TaxID=2502235 RepID=UPI0010F8313B|nr:type II secretion system protein [Chitinivorax sp. B]
MMANHMQTGKPTHILSGTCPPLHPSCPPHKNQHGLAYISLLFMLVLITLGLGKTLDVYGQQKQRFQEKQLLWVGTQYARAIQLYYETSPGTQKRFPPSLEALLDDTRFVVTRRHLRQLYPDPLTGKANWKLIIAAEGGIQGIASISNKMPIKQENFPLRWQTFAKATRFDNWQFVYAPKQLSGLGNEKQAIPQ